MRDTPMVEWPPNEHVAAEVVAVEARRRLKAAGARLRTQIDAVLEDGEWTLTIALPPPPAVGEVLPSENT